MLLLLVACDEPSKLDSSEVACDDGEIRLASDGMPYDTLHDALLHAASSDRVCIGAGTFEIGTPDTCGDGVYLDEGAARARFLVTMGCGDACPYIPGAKVEDWPLTDPKGQPKERVREIRDEVERRVRALVEAQGWGRET